MPKNKEIKRKEAIERQKKYNALTPLEKIKNLNKMFGENQGAKKERSKLKKQL